MSPRRTGLLPIDRRDPPLADLLAPHRVVEALELEQLVVAADFDDPTAFEHVNAIGVHDGRQSVRDQDRDDVRRSPRCRASCG